ncbi:MAG: hypothetical protein EOP04_21005 [Proteobacteria bacterium]|nr:MAG: hypothetical protein EOP04_21005 [Pseudomonadota bacterium]
MKTHVLLCALGLSISCSSETPAAYTAKPKAAADSKKAPASGDAEDKSSTGKTDTKKDPKTDEKDKSTDTDEDKDEVIVKEKEMEETDKEADDKAAEMKKLEEEKALVKKMTEVFDGFRWEFPCDEDPKGSDQCNSKAEVKVTKTLPVAAGRKFEVELQFRGIVEGMMYKNGKLEGNYFYTGGEPNNGTYNIYSIEVSSPKQIYYLNTQPNVGHNTFLIDYAAKIKVDAGATIKLTGNGQNGIEISNFKKLVTPGVEPKTFYNGQFIQMNVKSLNEIK